LSPEKGFVAVRLQFSEPFAGWKKATPTYGKMGQRSPVQREPLRTPPRG